MSNDLITQDDFLSWKQSSVTKIFLQHLAEERQAVMEAWANGAFTSETTDGTVQMNAKAIGKIEFIDDILNMTEADLNE